MHALYTILSCRYIFTKKIEGKNNMDIFCIKRFMVLASLFSSLICWTDIHTGERKNPKSPTLRPSRRSLSLPSMDLGNTQPKATHTHAPSQPTHGSLRPQPNAHHNAAVQQEPTK